MSLVEKLHRKELHLVYAGTPELAATVLQELLERSQHQITLVLTRPDSACGRGQKVTASAVKKLAVEHRLSVLQPSSTGELMALKDKVAGTDLMIVTAYGMLLPKTILNTPTYGCINVHTSLLPRWRGAAPIQRAIQAGDSETGISIIQMDSGLDTGAILLQKKCPITPTDTSASLHNKLTHIASDCLLETLEKIIAKDVQTCTQDHSQICYAKKITKSEARIDWMQSADNIERTIRAFNPAPVCHTELKGLTMRIWQAEIIDLNNGSTFSPAGTIIQSSKAGIDVATGHGVLRILKLQPQGKRAMSIADFLNGRPTFGTGSFK